MPLNLNTPIRRQEPLITDRLRLAFPKARFTLQRVPHVLSIAEFKSVVKLAPFIGLAFVGMRPDGDNARLLKGALQWRLILIDKASNGLEARFKGDRQSIGLDAMVDVAMVLLQGVTFAKEGFVTVTSASSVVADGFADDDIAVAQVDFTFSFTSPVAALELLTPEAFETLGITWSASEDASAPQPTDTVTIEQEA